MKGFFRCRWFKLLSVLVFVFTLIVIYLVASNKGPELITTTVEYGPVQQLVSVSGVAEAKDKADLSFPVLGVTEVVAVTVGDTVVAGEVLAVLSTTALETDRQEALAGLTAAVAKRGELIAGLTSTQRIVTDETVRTKEANLISITMSEAHKVTNAKRALLSNGLTAYTNKVNEVAPPPIITGTYSCDQEGTYTIAVYRSNAESEYSFKLSGLESGTYTAGTDQPAELGTCGLRIQFDTDANYGDSTWYVDVPNQLSPTYIVHKNAYELATVEATNAILLAEQDVVLAKATAANDSATPRPEALTQADAAVAQAAARVGRVEAEIQDRVMRAPFAGTITEINVKVGETVSTEPIISLMAAGEFEITARIPEIDVGKLQTGQQATMIFDAKSNETITGTLSFLSLQAIEIDGVAYFEAYIVPQQRPDWFRSGLNADIDIIIAEKQNNLRLPKRFVFNTDNGFAVLKATNDGYATTTVDVVLEGNDGYVALSGLNEGERVAAP